jgi:hypothetical protein
MSINYMPNPYDPEYQQSQARQARTDISEYPTEKGSWAVIAFDPQTRQMQELTIALDPNTADKLLAEYKRTGKIAPRYRFTGK